MEQTFFFTNQCTDFSDGVHFTTVYYNEYGDSSNSWNILNKTAKKLSDVNGSGDINIMDATQIQIIIAR